jgi:hypothetical protein
VPRHLEERIDQLIVDKGALAERVVGTGEAGLPDCPLRSCATCSACLRRRSVTDFSRPFLDMVEALRMGPTFAAAAGPRGPATSAA